MKNCGICGKEISGKGPKKYCLACSKIAYKIQQDTWRAKHKTVSSKTTEMMKCERCGKEIEARRARKYCNSCRKAVDEELKKKYIEKHLVPDEMRKRKPKIKSF